MDNITIVKIEDEQDKMQIVRQVLEALPEWFEMGSGREAYIADSAEMPLFAAYDRTEPIGFLCLKETGAATVELAVMEVLKSYHRQGIGKMLVAAAKKYA